MVHVTEISYNKSLQLDCIFRYKEDLCDDELARIILMMRGCTLTHLDIGFCKLITDKSLKIIAENAKMIVDLRISWLPNITDYGILFISVNCVYLRFTAFIPIGFNN